MIGAWAGACRKIVMPRKPGDGCGRIHRGNPSATAIVNRPRLLCTVVVALAMVGAAAANATAQERAPERASGWTPKAAVASKRDMVVAANPLAVDAGLRMLERGGNAVDAAIAVQLVLNLVEPQSSGIGGGAFMLFHNGRSGLLTAYDGRETAPAAAKPDRFLDASGKPLAFHDAVIGGRSVGVPGVLRMLELAHRQYGRLPWSTALRARHRARGGRLRGLAAPGRGDRWRERHLTQERAKAYFYHRDGTPVAAGQTLRNPAFAATLKRIAAGGADAFYKGEHRRATSSIPSIRAQSIPAT